MHLHNGRVAVVIPVYRATFLAEALESVFLQTRPADEVVLVDDGSPDAEELARAVAPYTGRITVLRQANAGAAAARNHGLAATSAEFVALLDADDRWHADFLREQLPVLEANADLNVVYSDGRFIGRCAFAGRRYTDACPSDGPVTFARLLAQTCTVLLSGVVARRAAITAVGGFDVSLRRGQDFDLWLRLARQGARIAHNPAVLVERRMHDANLGGTPVNEIERPLRVFAKVLATMPLSDAERAIAVDRMRVLEGALARERGKEMLRRGDWSGARTALLDACRESRGWKLHAAVLGLRIAPQLVRRLYLSRGGASAAPVS